MKSSSTTYRLQRLGPGDLGLLGQLTSVFARAFADAATYNDRRPDEAYLRNWLASDTVYTLVALHDDRVIGGLVAYELRKFEQRRNELYIYDLAVDEPFRRQGVATALLRETTRHAVAVGAHAVFVQADRDDPPAIRLYEGLGVREDVLHFDLHLPPRSNPEATAGGS